MHSENRIKKKIEFGKLLVRIDEIKYDENNDLWALRLMKLRDDNIPSKVKEDEIAEPINLEADEYIGEDMSILYEKEQGLSCCNAIDFHYRHLGLGNLFNLQMAIMIY